MLPGAVPGIVGVGCYEHPMDHECCDCRAGLDHCHGTLIHHVLHRAECTEPDCHAPELLPHTFVIDCDAVGCGCTEPVALAI